VLLLQAHAAQASPKPKTNGNQQEKWLKEDQLRNLMCLRSRKERKDYPPNAMGKARLQKEELRAINIEDKNLSALASAPRSLISYRLVKTAAGKNTMCPLC